MLSLYNIAIALRGHECEKLVKRNANDLEISGVGIESGPVKIKIGTFSFIERQLVKSLDLAVSLDSSQRELCKAMPNMGDEDPLKEDYIRIRLQIVLGINQLSLILASLREQSTDDLKNDLVEWTKYMGKLYKQSISKLVPGYTRAMGKGAFEMALVMKYQGISETQIQKAIAIIDEQPSNYDLSEKISSGPASKQIKLEEYHVKLKTKKRNHFNYEIIDTNNDDVYGVDVHGSGNIIGNNMKMDNIDVSKDNIFNVEGPNTDSSRGTKLFRVDFDKSIENRKVNFWIEDRRLQNWIVPGKWYRFGMNIGYNDSGLLFSSDAEAINKLTQKIGKGIKLMVYITSNDIDIRSNIKRINIPVRGESDSIYFNIRARKIFGIFEIAVFFYYQFNLIQVVSVPIEVRQSTNYVKPSQNKLDLESKVIASAKNGIDSVIHLVSRK